MKTATLFLLLLLAAWGGLASAAYAQACPAPTGVATSSPTATTIVVSFNPVAAASQYVVRYYWTGDSTAAGIKRRFTPTSPVTLTGLRPASTYRLLVGSICRPGDTIYAASRLFVTSGGAPVACAPITNASISGLAASGATVSFAPVSGASSYTISYYAVGDSANTHTLTTSNSSAPLAGLAAGTAYVVRVRTNCGPGLVSTPVILTFRTLASAVPCGAVTNVVVTGTSASTATVSFTPGPGNLSFSITYHLANDSTHRVNVSASPATITGLVPGQTYYVQVISQCGAGSGTVYTNSSSIPFSFRGASPLSARQTLGAGMIETYPNPAHHVLHLLLPAVPGAAAARVTLLNSLGQPLKTIQLAMRNAATEAQLDVAGVAPGLYTVRVVVGEQQASQRVVIE